MSAAASLPTQATVDRGRIVVVDDDPGVRGLIGAFLSRRGYEVATAADGAGLHAALAERPADVVVLDLMLPGEDGLSLCRRLSRPGGPAIIILSGLDGETERIVGLEVGADHYVAKPCNPDELLARVRAVLRRRRVAGARASGPGDASPPALCFAGWRLDAARHELRAPDGVVVFLPAAEFALLRAFAERPRRVLSRHQLLALVADHERGQDPRLIDVRISRLRARLAAHDEDLITTVRNEGYALEARVTQD
jgi:two-component system OmpR family response regulator